MRRFLIADDHTVVREGLRQILQDAFPSAFVDEVPDGEDLLKKVMTEHWDIVISDITMPGRSGLDILKQIKQNHPKLPVLILSMHQEDHYAIRALKAGASGYLNKDCDQKELIEAVNRLMLGKKYITFSIAEKLTSNFEADTDKLPHELLSDREFEVFKFLATGKTVSDIADQLFLSTNTVSTYRARILSKMHLKSNAELTLYAMENKLI
jgi:two-component system, NarL family, invasion response regulator UvrY